MPAAVEGIIPAVLNRVTRNLCDAETESAMTTAGLGTAYIGVDAGAETLKLVELERVDGRLQIRRACRVEHGKNPGSLLDRMYREWNGATLSGAASTGRLSKQFQLERVPNQQAQSRAFRFLYPETAGTLISIGSQGFSVLELHADGRESFRENSRCSQGTGNFLRQLTGRFSLSVEDASALCTGVEHPAMLSGRCPVILKSDMTHLANKGESRAEILAGLFDAVCENVLNLVKPGRAPNPMLLIGGVSQSLRVQKTIQSRLHKLGYQLLLPGEEALYWEALGAALIAAEEGLQAPDPEHLLAAAQIEDLERTPAFAGYLSRVHRMPAAAWEQCNGCSRDLIFGLDIGSTGSKAVAFNPVSQRTVWDAYCQTQGRPIEAAQSLWRSFLDSQAGKERVRGVCVTGSGREIVGSLLTKCYGPQAIFIQNEIAAHAAGACHYDPRVDTIFEIGGQDSKYIRLEQGRVIDSAMNEACSAGTGSFIEEQGRKFAGIEHIEQLGEAALLAEEGVSLGQHCSVFMAEIIDEAVAAGLQQNTIIAGLYDSIIQNYLNRVKGNRTVGQVIFCQGMPFSADALAAAVARQTGSEVIVPPNPGTVGALGIALLGSADLAWKQNSPLDLHTFLNAQVEQRTTFICNATVGCGSPGNHCRIECLKTCVEGTSGIFTWGGACSLHERISRRKKLPDMAPQPFREREQLVAGLLEQLAPIPNAPAVALSDEFMLKELLPFFATFLHALGFNLKLFKGTDPALLKRGIQQTNAPFCAPMQLFHGVASLMRESNSDFVFTPILRSTLRSAQEEHAKTCPIVQSAPYLLRYDLERKGSSRWLSPEIEVGPRGFESGEFRANCAQIAQSLGVENLWEPAYQAGVSAQLRFGEVCESIGRHALEFCRENNVTPVVVLGRPYTIYNPILNSSVPTILREQGTLAIPIDCYPIPGDAPFMNRIYWGYAQRILRAAHVIRRSSDVYSVYCSNYSCGPDSLNLHFFSYVMRGKPFAVIETDGHSGDAGTKTRIEAFLHCVTQDRAASGSKMEPLNLPAVTRDSCDFSTIDKNADTVLVPWMGPGSRVGVACLRAAGFQAEELPQCDRHALLTGRRYTSGKECVPVVITLGRLIEKLRSDPNGHFAFMMPRTNGPCRLGLYHLIQKIVVEQLSMGDRCRFVVPSETDYFAGLPPGFTTLFIAGVIAHDLLQAALLMVRPDENIQGAAGWIYERRLEELCQILSAQQRVIQSRTRTFNEVLSGRLFGVRDLLRNAAQDFAAIYPQDAMKDAGDSRNSGCGRRPVVLLVGEIYVRNDSFANDDIIRRLEARGMRVRFASLNGWFQYVDYQNSRTESLTAVDCAIDFLKRRMERIAWDAIGKRLPIGEPAEIGELVEAASDYLAGDAGGEAVLTLGEALHSWHGGEMDAVVNVGPHECMPTRIVESQLFHMGVREGLPSLTLTFNGDPMPEEALDNFAFEVHKRYRQRVNKNVRPGDESSSVRITRDCWGPR